jgi:hypothetical protein
MAANPLINGNYHDYSCLRIRANGKEYVGILEISYSHKLEPGSANGTQAQRLGRTRGKYEAEASFTMLKRHAEEFKQGLGDGYMEKPFDVLCDYADDSGPLITDLCRSCRIKNEEDSHSDGSDALKTKFDLDVMYLKKGGLKPLANLKE